MADILGLMGHVQRQGELGRERGQQTLLGKLSGQAYTAPQDQRAGILSQMASVDPQAAQSQQQQFRTGDADRVTQLSQKAKLFVGLAKSGNQQAVAAMYPQIAREAREAFGVEVPETYDPSFLAGIEQFANLGAGQAGTGVQSTYIDDKGQRVAILRDGSTQILGQNAPQNQIIDTGNGFYGVNKGNLQAAPVQIGGGAPQQPQAPQSGMYQTPQGVVRLGDDLSPEQREAAMADIAAGGGASSVQLLDRGVSQPGGSGQQLRSAPASITPYQQAQLDMQRARTAAATSAKNDAAAARKAAEDIKANAKKQEADARLAASRESADALIAAIDDLERHPGFSDLGTEIGDLKIATPIIRSGVKDADAKLKNIAGQVALATLSKLKTLSSAGATGFGALSAPELRLVQDSIATLQSENISNAEIRRSLKVIRETMQKTTQWQPPQDAAPSNAINVADDDESLFGKYLD